MFDFWHVYSGEQFRASWPSCFSIPAAFSLQVIFLLDLAFETLGLFENVAFVTAEPGITLYVSLTFLPI